jgi:tetratricopeptide (TPR) repeat protein
MSLIHQALKKVQTIEKAEALPVYSEGLKGRLSFNLPAIRVRAILLILSLLILVFAVWWAMFFKKPRPDLISTEQTNRRQIRSGESLLPDANSSSAVTAEQPALTAGSDDSFLAAIESAKTKNLKGVELYKQGRFFLANAEFLSSIEIFPEYAEAYNNIGLTYKQMGDMKSAEENYQKAIQYKPGYPEAMNNYGILLEAKGNSNAAREYFKKAILIAPDYPDPYFNMAVSLENSKKIEDAVIYYEGFLSHAEKVLRQDHDKIFLKDVRERVLYLKVNNLAVEKDRE